MEHAGGYANHSMTSPLKNVEAACAKCHDSSGLKTKVLALQDGVMQKAKQLELVLDAVLTKIEALAGSGFDPAKLAQAKERFMRALLRWDWTAVAGSSAGFHNASEANANLAAAESELAQAKALLGL
jgi:nitrite reductase (cytochrome c-552)